MPPTSCPGSPCSLAAAANARGKLAPHNSAAGSSAHKQRTMSIWNVYQGLVESSGLIGQYGSEFDSMYAVQATAPASSIWLQPSSALGFRASRASIEPPVLPIAMPTRNTAKMMENV